MKKFMVPRAWIRKYGVFSRSWAVILKVTSGLEISGIIPPARPHTIAGANHVYPASMVTVHKNGVMFLHIHAFWVNHTTRWVYHVIFIIFAGIHMMFNLLLCFINEYSVVFIIFSFLWFFLLEHNRHKIKHFFRWFSIQRFFQWLVVTYCVSMERRSS